jgi:hypothetical protein
MVAAYRKNNNIPDPEDEITTTDDLDDLYAAFGEVVKANPEEWH